MKKAVRVTISGKVQGVFFREFIDQNARSFNLCGYVKNLSNGTLEAFIEGNESFLDKMVEICKKGPKNSVVEKFEVKEEIFQNIRGFKILY